MTVTVPFLILSLAILNEAAYPSFLEEITSLSKRAGSSAPSYAECNIDDDEREDCGFYGVTSHQCQSRGCCWRSSNRQGAPWCYHSSRNLHLKCVSVAESRRQECGFPGISASQCVKQDCCWRPTQRARTPWCYTSSDPTGSSESCGSPAIRPSVSSRIIGGKDAVAHSWPWQVSIQDAEEGHKCGGSLISQQWVITAAHCRDLDEDTTIELGLHRSEIPDEQTVSRGIAGVYIHPEYKKGGRQILNDLLLIKLSEPISYTKAISPICLPPHGQDVQPGSTCYATGWGNVNNRGEMADELQQLAVPVLDRATCNQPDWYDGYVTSDMICAGYQQGNKDACKGDSGGPLECRGNGGSWLLAGVTSWGWGCAKQNHPGVYAKVSNYIDWIASTMRKHS